ncbi:MAG: biopolymer transporter ExbD [Deltaproteobacteria bacterium]|nr:biopolymer transporter ExbD [Deltaproteobacteria bacterium]
MAAAQQDDGDDLISAINVTPLVDVFLVLLVIFMVTASIFLEQEQRLREIPLTLPTAASGAPPSEKDAPISIVLDRAGRVWLDGKQVDVEAVGRLIDDRRAAGRTPEAVLSADKDLPYGRVARVIDFAKLHGIGNLAINVEEQEIAPLGTP